MRAPSESVAICPIVERCGGCPRMTLTEAEQREKAMRAVCEVFEKEGLRIESSLQWLASPSRYGYRNRLRLKAHPDGRIGFFNLEKDIDCAVLSQPLRTVIQRLAAWSAKHPAQAQHIDHLEARAPDADNLSGAYLVLKAETRAALDLKRMQEQLGTDLKVATEEPNRDMPSQRFHLDDRCYTRVPLGTFMQVNHAVNEQLRTRVVQQAERMQALTFADLFCGAGNLSMPLLARGLSGRAVENNPESIRGARQAATEQGLDADAFIAGDAADAATRWLDEGLRFDLLVSNPPRAGMKDAAQPAISLGAPVVVIGSCNPSSLARDVAQFVDKGYRLRETTLLDMFSHTSHVETLIWLER